jgi:hypothetical protein
VTRQEGSADHEAHAGSTGSNVIDSLLTSPVKNAAPLTTAAFVGSASASNAGASAASSTAASTSSTAATPSSVAGGTGVTSAAPATPSQTQTQTQSQTASLLSPSSNVARVDTSNLDEWA